MISAIKAIAQSAITHVPQFVICMVEEKGMRHKSGQRIHNVSTVAVAPEKKATSNV